jgi:hypothetical protein
MTKLALALLYPARAYAARTLPPLGVRAASLQHYGTSNLKKGD